MARTIEIWDNHWKDVPKWTFVLMLIGLLGIMLTSFLGAELFFKNNHLFSALVSVGIGVLIYILVYRSLKHKEQGAHGKGVITGALLVIPFADYTLFGGMGLCNELGFREAQFKELQTIASDSKNALNTQSQQFASIGSATLTSILSECATCGDKPRSQDRTACVKAMEACYNTAYCTQCASGSTSSLRTKLTKAMDDRFKAKAIPQLELESFIFKVEQGGLSSRFNQYLLQQDAGRVNELLDKTRTQKYSVVIGICYGARNGQTLSPLRSVRAPQMDCSSPTSLFCQGWNARTFVALLLLMVLCLIPIPFGDSREGAPEAKTTGDMSMEL